MPRTLVLCMIGLLLAVAGRTAPPDIGAGQNQPVYIYLFSRMDDHVNFALTEERIERTMTMMDRLRAQAPTANVRVLLEFSGASSDVIGQRNKASRVADAVLRHVRDGAVEVGYYGAMEPTPMTRPAPNFRGLKTPRQRWLARLQPLEWSLTEYKEYLTGEPDPAAAGGLKRTREVFGDVTSIAGVNPMELGGDAESIHLLKNMQKTPFTMPGIPEPQTWPARNLHGFGGAVFGFSNMMSPAPAFAPELYFADGVLHVSDNNGQGVRIVPAYKGPDALMAMIKNLNRSRPHVIRVQLGASEMYLQPTFNRGILDPLRYAYENPKIPYLPKTGALRPSEEIEAAYAKEAELIRWLVQDFFPQNSGSRFISSGDLIRMTEPPSEAGIPREVLAQAVHDMVTQWREIGNNPPSFARAGENVFSLAEMFQMLAKALSGLDQAGSLPAAVRPLPVYGPDEMAEEQGPGGGSIPVASLARAATVLSGKFEHQEWKPLPENMIPGWVEVEGIRLNAAQCLRLMAEAFLAGDTSAKLTVKTSQMFSPAAELYPRTRQRTEEGSMWTLKPARLRM